jgi:N utilization substance protein B
MEGFAKADREFFVGTLRGVIAQHEKLASRLARTLTAPLPNSRRLKPVF